MQVTYTQFGQPVSMTLQELVYATVIGRSHSGLDSVQQELTDAIVRLYTGLVESGALSAPQLCRAVLGYDIPGFAIKEH